MIRTNKSILKIAMIWMLFWCSGALIPWCPDIAYADFETARRSGSGSNIASAEKLFLEGKYERCAYESQALIDSGSRQRDELYYLKGLSEMKAAKFKIARNTFETILFRYPQSKRSFDAYTGIGDSYFLEGNTNQAIRVYNEILNKFPDDSNINTVHSRIKECNARLGVKDKMRAGFQAREIPRGVERGAFSVQIGSFKNKRNAERLARKLSGKGYKAYVEVPAGSGDKLYRVKVGPFKSREDADTASAHLKGDGYRNRICAEA